MGEYKVENLEFLVKVFYNGEPDDRAKAHAWLTAAQRVPEAWTFVWELLQPHKGTEIQFYGATTLHTKILRCWHEVPPESYEELKEKLLQAVYTYSNGPKIVTNRLCISLAAFILQQGTVDLADILRPLSATENANLLLEVLTVIPEEYSSMTMGSQLRSKNRAALTQACPAVLDDLLHFLQSVYNEYTEPPPEATVQLWLYAATCAISWMTLGGEDAPDAGAALPARLPLCAALLAAVRVMYTWNEAVSDTALDLCEACLSGVRAACGPDSARQPAAALQLIEQLAALAAPVLARDNRPDSINEELLASLITCMVGVGESHAGAIVRAVEADPQAPARRLVELLLEAQAAPGHYPVRETRSNLVFGFWYTLQDEILNVMERTSKITAVWREVFSRLLSVLVVKAEAPPDSALSCDEQEMLRCYRQDIADTVMYCVGILGDWCWATVEAAYEAADGPTRREAALHVFLALADSAPQRAPDALRRLLARAVSVAGAEQGRLLHTALDCLGSYSGWVSGLEAARGAALARECVSAAGAALARAPAPAALALRKLCADCPAPAAAMLADIVAAAQSSQAREDAWVRRQLLSAAGSALGAADPDVAAPLLRQLADTLAQDLREQAQNPLRAKGAGGAAECCGALLAALPAQPALCAALCGALLPTLPAFAQHPQLVEPMFHILKQMVSSLMDDCRPLADDIGRLTMCGLTVLPCAAGLDVVKLLVLVFGDSWAEAARLLHAGVALSARRVAPEPSAAPDLAEALFALLRTLTKKKPQYMDWIEDLLPELVELGSACIRMWEAGAARAACQWLGALAAERASALAAAAPALTAAALRCIGGATPRGQVEPLAELLLALNRAAWPPGAGLQAWLPAALAAPGFPTVHATDPHKHKFIAAVIKEKSSKRRLLESVQEFSLVCRGLVGTEYARQTLASRQLVA